MLIADQLRLAFPQLDFKPDYDLSTRTYCKLGGKAEVYLELANRQQIIKLIKFCGQKKIKLTLLGGASNVIVDEQGISGLVLHLKNNHFKLLTTTIGSKIIVQAGAGIKTSLLVKKTIAENLTGLELFLGIPGTLGGAIYNNSHYQQELIGDHVHRVEVINKNGRVSWLNRDQCKFEYDFSRFQTTQEIILRVELALEKSEKTTSQALAHTAAQHRAQSQPLGLPSLGCIFKNTSNTPRLKKLFPQFQDQKFISTGFLIDQAGLKGMRVGKIEVSTKHAAFFVNRGGGSVNDLKKLIRLVKRVIKTKFKVQLKEEVFYLS